MIRKCTTWLALPALLASIGSASADETFVTIHAVNGRYIQITPSAGSAGMGRRRGGAATSPGPAGTPARTPGQAGRGRPRFGRGAAGGGGSAPGAMGRGRARAGGQATAVTTTILLPPAVKVTTAMRERRTFEFRVMGEIAGGLRNPIFARLKAPLPARLVSRNGVITEVNVITGDTDINQTATSSSGESIIAVKPKRPPMKRKRP